MSCSYLSSIRSDSIRSNMDLAGRSLLARVRKHSHDLLPAFRTKLSMIFAKERGRVYVEEQEHGSADDRGTETSRIRAESGRRGAGGGRFEAYALRVESKVWRHVREPGARGETVAGRELATAETGRRSEPGQRSVAVGDKKKRLELVALKAAIGQMRQDYAFSERRACGLMML